MNKNRFYWQYYCHNNITWYLLTLFFTQSNALLYRTVIIILWDWICVTRSATHKTQVYCTSGCVTGQEKKIEMHLSSGQVSLCFPCPTFNSTCPLSKLERTERTSMFYHLSRKNVLRNYGQHVYLSFEWVNTNSHRQNNLSRTRGHHVFRSLSYRQRVQCLSKGRQVLVRYEMTFLLKKTPHFCYKHCHKIILNSDFVLKSLFVQVFTDNHQFPALCLLKAILTANIDTTWTEKAHFFHTYRGMFVLAYSELHVGMI